jgi:serine/threonine-protein kinase
MGILETGDAPPGHRIFVDEHTVGQTPESVLVKCGKATVKLGSAGQPHSVDIPCGGKLSVEQP